MKTGEMEKINFPVLTSSDQWTLEFWVFLMKTQSAGDIVKITFTGGKTYKYIENGARAINYQYFNGATT